MEKQKHPFVPGARVAMSDGGGYHETQYREAFVDKVYKTGNFTLVGREGQWRPSSSGNPWTASVAGNRDSWSREYLKLWDAETDAEISASNKKAKRVDRMSEIIKRLEYVLRNRREDITEAMLDVIEGALPKLEPPQQ